MRQIRFVVAPSVLEDHDPSRLPKDIPMRRQFSCHGLVGHGLDRYNDIIIAGPDMVIVLTDRDAVWCDGNIAEYPGPFQAMLLDIVRCSAIVENPCFHSGVGGSNGNSTSYGARSDNQCLHIQSSTTSILSIICLFLLSVKSGNVCFTHLLY